MGHGDGSTRRSHSAATKSVNERPPMNTDRCSSVLLACKSLSGGQGYFHREDAKSAKKSDFKNFAFFAVDFWVAAGLLCVHQWFQNCVGLKYNFSRANSVSLCALRVSV